MQHINIIEHNTKENNIKENNIKENNVKGIIFDMDGVLFDTEVLYERFWCEAARQLMFNMTPRHVAAIRSTDAKKAAQITKELLGDDFDYYAVRNLRKQLMEEYINEHGLIKKAGVEKTLKVLKEHLNLKIALATTSNHQRAEKYLQLGKIRQYFDELVCGDMVLKGKPDPMIYETAAKALGLKPDECIAVEDSFNGVRSAYGAGCKVYMVPDRDVPDKEMQDKTINILSSLDQIVEEIYFGEK